MFDHYVYASNNPLLNLDPFGLDDSKKKFEDMSVSEVISGLIGELWGLFGELSAQGAEATKQSLIPTPNIPKVAEETVERSARRSENLVEAGYSELGADAYQVLFVIGDVLPSGKFAEAGAEWNLEESRDIEGEEQALLVVVGVVEIPLWVIGGGGGKAEGATEGRVAAEGSAVTARSVGEGSIVGEVKLSFPKDIPFVGKPRISIVGFDVAEGYSAKETAGFLRHEAQHVIDITTSPRFTYHAKRSLVPGRGISCLLFETRGYLAEFGLKGLNPKHAWRSMSVLERSYLAGEVTGIGYVIYHFRQKEDDGKSEESGGTDNK